MKNNNTAYLVLFLTTLFWSLNAIAGKLAVGHISPMVLTSIRWIVAFSIMLIIGGRQFWIDRHTVRAHLPLLMVLGAVGFTLFNVSMYTALNYTTAINVAIEQAAVPAVIFLGNFILFRTRVSALQVIGFTFSLIGVAIMVSNGSLERLAKLEINQGDAIMVLAVILYASYSVLLKYKPDLHWKTVMLVMSFSALIVSLPFGIWEITSGNAILPDALGFSIALYTAIFPSLVSQVLWMKGISLIGPNRAGIFINLVPIIATCLAIIILGEKFGIHHGVALVTVIGGIWLAEKSGRKIIA